LYSSAEGSVLRTCAPIAVDDCKEINGVTYCYCKNELCNSPDIFLDDPVHHTLSDGDYPIDYSEGSGMEDGEEEYGITEMPDYIEEDNSSEGGEPRDEICQIREHN
jgi:hypothetical protein